MALCLKTLSYKHFIEPMVENMPIVFTQNFMSHGVVLVVIYEAMFGSGHRNRFWRKILNPYKAPMSDYLKTYMLQEEIITKRGICKHPVRVPRFVRINTLKINPSIAIEAISKNGFSLKPNTFSSCLEYFKAERRISHKEFIQDSLFPNILAFHPSTDFHDFEMVKKGELILQEKASCLPPLVLKPPKGSCVLDCCAAPGNKTSQLAEILQNTGQLIAIERDPSRMRLLKRLLKQRSCKFLPVETCFLQTNPNVAPYCDVEYILLDPTCSSSGIVKLHDNLLRREGMTAENAYASKDDSKARQLSLFQTKALSHALSFPKLKALVYSTCSVYAVVFRYFSRRKTKR